MKSRRASYQLVLLKSNFLAGCEVLGGSVKPSAGTPRNSQTPPSVACGSATICSYSTSNVRSRENILLNRSLSAI